MKNPPIFATSWLIGFPVGILFIASMYIFSSPVASTISSGSSDTYLKAKKYRKNPDASLKFIPTPVDCDSKKIAEVREEAKDEKGKRSVTIDCNLTLDPRYPITKRMIFEGPSASGVTLDCNGTKIDCGKPRSVNYNGDMIEVRSTYTDGFIDNKKIRIWHRPEKITIKNCLIKGSVRIWGMSKNGEGSGSEYPTGKFVRINNRKIEVEGNFFKESSRSLNHEIRARNNAPTNIVLDHVTISGVNRNPVYFAPGVTNCKLVNSEINGKSEKVGIYLDAESAYNTIENNLIHVSTEEDGFWAKTFGYNRGWPQVAIDGSSWNKIIGNEFGELRNGGIYLYRNCGEGGVIRHTRPEHNEINNNTFLYKHYTGLNPAIYLNSRDYGWKERDFGHCGADEGKPFGSSISNKDHAQYNIIKQNKFHKRKINLGGVSMDATCDFMIRIKNKSTKEPNNISENIFVGKDGKRSGPCNVSN